MVPPTICVDPMIRGRNTPLVLNRLLIMPTLLTSGFLTMLSGCVIVSWVLLALVLMRLLTLRISVRPRCLVIGNVC